ncbi:MAG: hypothetical protein WD767_14690 [Alphaproteobacteria bacterium]
MKYPRVLWPVIAAGLFLASLGVARAENLSPETFYGTFQGSGYAENRDSLYFGSTVRDLDVVIGPSGGGFSVTWTTVIRGGSPNDPKIKRKAQTVNFSPAGQPGVFRGTPSGDPLAGNPYVWARIEEHTMTTYILTISGDGTYEMQSYARTMSGAGMDLVFTRIRDGEPVRSAQAKLVKLAN